MRINDVENLLLRIDEVRDEIYIKPKKEDLDYTIDEVLTECSVLLSNQKELIDNIEDSIARFKNGE